MRLFASFEKRWYKNPTIRLARLFSLDNIQLIDAKTNNFG